MGLHRQVGDQPGYIVGLHRQVGDQPGLYSGTSQTGR